MVDGVVRKVYVCFFDESVHADRTPVERIAIDITLDRESDGRADEGSDEGRTGRRRDEDRSLDQTTLQVSRCSVQSVRTSIRLCQEIRSGDVTVSEVLVYSYIGIVVLTFMCTPRDHPFTGDGLLIP